MRLSSLLKEEHILIDLPGERLSDGVNALAALLAKELEPNEVTAVAEALERRRGVTSDYIRRGVAIPHARVEGLRDFRICIGNSKQGLLLDTTPEDDSGRLDDDEQRVRLVFLVLTPQTKNTLMLQALAAIARLCHSQDTRSALQTCKSPARLLRLIEESDVEVKRTVTASDAARPCEYRLRPDEDLSVALSRLAGSGERALPVIDDKEQLCGMVRPADLFQLGLPKYINILTDVDFLTNFEPFEKIFLNERKLTVAQIACPDAAAVEENAPIIQVAHLMVTKPAPAVFVLDAKKRVRGVIDERDILGRVLQP